MLVQRPHGQRRLATGTHAEIPLLLFRDAAMQERGSIADSELLQLSPFKKIGTDERYVEEVLITAGDDVNQVSRRVMGFRFARADVLRAAADPTLHQSGEPGRHLGI